MTKVSIILTTYNHKDFIKDAIESVLNQSFSNWELLIGDDSSNDESWNIVEEYVKKYGNINAWHHNPNKGIVDNMNFLIDKISEDSDYVVFLEGDDILKQNYIDEKLNIFSKYPEVNLVYNNLDVINSNGKVIQKDIFGFRHIKTYKNKIINPNDFVSANVGPVISWSTIMIRRGILDNYRIRSLNPQNKRYAISDYDFCFSVVTENKVYYLDNSLTLYRRHSSNLSAGNNDLLNELGVLVEEYYKLGKISKKTFENKLSQNNVMIALMCLEKGEKKQSLGYLIKSFKYSLFNSVIFKLGTLCLLILPLRLSKRILSMIVRRD